MNNNMIIYICIASFIITYITLYTCNYININDKQKIKCSIKNKTIISLVNTALIALLYIRYGLSIDYIFYMIIWVGIFVISYIDYATKFIYDFMAKPFMMIALSFFIVNLILEKTNIQEAVFLIIPLSIIIVFEHLNYIGKGDIQIFLVSIITINDFVWGLILVIFSFGISGIASIVMMIFKNVGLNYRKPLCPSIAMATYFVLLLM